jgi:hypothetical protein
MERPLLPCPRRERGLHAFRRERNLAESDARRIEIAFASAPATTVTQPSRHARRRHVRPIDQTVSMTGTSALR